MRFACDANNNRIRPTESGQRATCPLCGGMLIGKCGDIYIEHWAHHHDSNCDPWKEHETEWHRKWKSNFPEDWQEVIIGRDGEKHIADVRTPSGTVIEFQNSPISTGTIEIREEFYEDMIWVINAESFWKNLKLRSVVTKKLDLLEQNLYHISSTIENENQMRLDELEKKVKVAEVNTQNKAREVRDKQSQLERIEEYISKQDELALKFNSEHQRPPYHDRDIQDILFDVDSQYGSPLKTLQKEIAILQDDRKSKQNKLKAIDTFKDYSINSVIHKSVNYSQIDTKYFAITKAITKESESTFFPDIITFNTQRELENLSPRKDKYNFYIDANDIVRKLKTRISEITILIQQKEVVAEKQYSDLKINLGGALTKKAEVIRDEFNKLDEEWDALITIEGNHSSTFVQTKYRLDGEIENLKREEEEQLVQDRFKAMKEGEGFYTYYWKHERKTWQAANCRIFFDNGKGLLYEKVSAGRLRRTSLDEFFSFYRDNTHPALLRFKTHLK